MPHLIDGAALARAWAQANKEPSTEPDTGPLSDFGTLSDFVDAPNRSLIVSPAWPKFSFSFQPIVNTTTGRKAIEASFDIRRACIDYSIPCITESDASVAFLIALKKRNEGSFDVTSL